MGCSSLAMIGHLINDVLSFVIFSILDVLDLVLCYGYKVIDFLIESEWKPCYCSSPKEAIASSGKILVSETGEAKKIVCLTSTKLQLEEISDTLYTRPSLVSEVSKTTVKELKRRKLNNTTNVVTALNKATIRSSTFTVNNTIVEMLQEKIGGHKSHPIPRWSDCDCDTCNSWSNMCNDSLFVHTDGPKDKVGDDVLFIHGFISSSAFWTETVFPNFMKTTKSTYRLFAVDLLGFGRSPKPHDSLYTIKEHLDMIEKSVLEEHKVKSFHIVAHSLGCILALALAVKYPNSVKSLTLIAPPYFPTPKGEHATQYMMRKVAPRRVWPLIAFGASLACWIKTYLIKGFCCHTHNAAWHTLHNIICGTAGKIEGYLDTVQNNLTCSVNIFHGQYDELIPVECSSHVKTKVPRANVKVLEKKDHITIVVGRQEAFARELEEIWKSTNLNR
ncbi:putative lysophospholipase BODYGUARD 3 isoform X2 [Bidens hawaiensis]|uniref:putative lysophospholipase BODYGUARD 3 isoform X2 n=1 Tax=Bidens hawaiensis TaxID=980011 RepID=UPI0040492C5F